VQVRYRYRIYPSAGQQRALARAFGCARVVYNDCLRLRDACHAAGEKISDTEMQRRVITLAKLTPERAWLAEVASVALVQACQDARRAYRNWFDSLSGNRKGRKVGHPAFRRKHHRQSIRLTRNGFALHGRKLYAAKVGRHRVAVLHRKVREARLDHAHKTALRVVRDNQAVYAEDLAVSGLMRTRLAKSVADAGWSLLLRLIEEKAIQYGRTFRRIGRFEPTSQVCSACGVKDGPKPLSVRTWACAACGAVHDRDVNAARNILAAGRADKSNACGGQVRPAALLAPAGEAGTLRGAV
jgi:transposase